MLMDTKQSIIRMFQWHTVRSAALNHLRDSIFTCAVFTQLKVSVAVLKGVRDRFWISSWTPVFAVFISPIQTHLALRQERVLCKNTCYRHRSGGSIKTDGKALMSRTHENLLPDYKILQYVNLSLHICWNLYFFTKVTWNKRTNATYDVEQFWMYFSHTSYTWHNNTLMHIDYTWKPPLINPEFS